MGTHGHSHSVNTGSNPRQHRHEREGITAMNTRDTLQAIYLDWVNNYLTVSVFAAHNELTEEEATRLIELGRKIHERLTA